MGLSQGLLAGIERWDDRNPMSDSLQILMLVYNRVGQGTYWRAFHLGRSLSRLGYAITLVATSSSRRKGIKAYTQDGINLIETPDLFSGSLRSGWDPWNMLNRIYSLREKKFNLIHAFESRPTVIYPACYKARTNRAPLVIDWADWFGRGGSVEERPNPILRTILRPVETYFEEHFRPSAQGNTVISTTLQEKALRLGINPQSIFLLENGSDTDRISPMPKAMARQRLGIDPTIPLIGYMGAIFMQDAQLLAGAFDWVTTRSPAAYLAMIGRSPVDIRSLVRHPQAVIQTGYVDDPDLNAYLAACDLLWLPLNDSNANRGRFPLKLTDYMAAGRPVVATAVGDVTTLIEDGHFGLISTPDPEALARLTVQLLEDPHLQQQMGERARRLAESRFCWGAIAERLAQFYRTVMERQ